jgi:hypothetical protein
MKRVILESPYAGNIEKNIFYAKLCIKDMLKRGEAPIASHLLFTQPGILDDNNPEERKLGIAAGLAWLPVADLQAFYVDYGMSNGMVAAFKKAQDEGRLDKCELRTLGVNYTNKLDKLFPVESP